VCACLISVSDASQKEENEFALNRERERVKTMLKENDICVEKQKEEQSSSHLHRK